MDVKIIAIVTICSIAAISYIRNKDIFHPVVAFLGINAVVCILAGLRLYELNEGSDQVYTIVALGCLFFAMGAVSSHYGVKINVDSNQCNFISNYRDIVLIFLYGLSIGFLLIDLIVLLPYFTNGIGMDSIRDMMNDPTSVLVSRRSGFETVLRNFIMFPFSFTAFLIGFNEFIKDNKKGRKYLILGFAVSLLRCITEGGRVILLYTIIFCVFIFRMNKLTFKNRIKKKYKILMVLFVVSVIYIVYKVTLTRTSEDILQHLYYYFSMPIPYFTARLDLLGENFSHTMGYASFDGYIFPFFMILKNFFGISYPDSFITAKDIYSTSQALPISSYRSLNTFITPFFYFYVDGGYAGVIAISFLYGRVCTKAYKKMMKNGGDRNTLIYALLLLGLIMSFVRFQFNQVNYAFSFLYILLLYDNSKKTSVEIHKRIGGE